MKNKKTLPVKGQGFYFGLLEFVTWNVRPVHTILFYYFFSKLKSMGIILALIKYKKPSLPVKGMMVFSIAKKFPI
ncbi:hypothetical protein [Peribacillus frigoritolerans]|uniref:hypothetical protein n=1 Tax=Peribacillus frigoritolerans TaxID=450367 RepID=UPI001F503D88|nr:hypothetical protein [Peribacillus frigoritolerans]MCK2018188.1 hypothetical protein [Peribacillus frigoritolerans]